MRCALTISSFLMVFAAAPAAAKYDLQPRGVMSLPVPLVISETLENNVPKINGETNQNLMRLICSLARGERTQHEINTLLEMHRVKVSSIPFDNHPLSLLVNGDKSKRQAACASWLAASIFEAKNFSAYKEVTKECVKLPRTAQPASRWRFWLKPGQECKTFVINQTHWNKEKFIEEARVQYALVMATAQLYSLIANDLEGGKVFSPTELNRIITQSVNAYAEDYLLMVKEKYRQAIHSQIVVEDLDDHSYGLRDRRLNTLVKSSEFPCYVWRGITWLDMTTIMGERNFIYISVSPDTPESAE